MAQNCAYYQKKSSLCYIAGKQSIMAIEQDNIVQKFRDGQYKATLGEPMIFAEGDPRHEQFKKELENGTAKFPETNPVSAESFNPLEHAGVGSWKPGCQTGVKPIEKLDSKDLLQTADPIKTPGQNYAVISYLSPPASDKFGLKISGCFSTMDEANEQAKRLMEKWPYFDIFVIAMYNWISIPLPDELKSEVEHVYADQTLNKIMSEFRGQQVKYRAGQKTRIKETHVASEKGGVAPVQDGMENQETSVSVEPSDVDSF